MVGLTDSLSMTIAVDWDVKPQTKQKIVNIGIGVATIAQVMHVGNKNSNIQGRSLNVIKVIFHTIRNCS